MKKKNTLESQMAELRIKRNAAFVAYGSEIESTLRVIVESLRHGRKAAAQGKSIARFSTRLDRALLRADDVLRQVRDARDAF